MYQQLDHDPSAPRPPSETMPTMYDLPSENPEDLGLPDLFHLSQPRFLDETLHSPIESSRPILTASDLNLYFDGEHPQWYKRPDWFMVLDKPATTQQSELRLSYVVWQEVKTPFLVIELLSPGTESEDLGRTLREVNRPPTKWQVYEQILRVPYYGIFDRYINQFRLFCLWGTTYREIELTDQRAWFPDLELGLGVWAGAYQGVEGLWLRWYDNSGWIPTLAERAEQEAQRAEQEAQRAEQAESRAARLVARLRELGVED